MKKLTFGDFIIQANIKAAKKYYQEKPPYFYTCTCPGCQNFFKTIKPYEKELEATLAPLGADVKKPFSVEVVYAKDNMVTYDAIYMLKGKIITTPKIYTTIKNNLGTVKICNQESFCTLNERMAYAFVKHSGELALMLRATLPWEMETMGCIYDSKQKIIKPRKFRIERIIETIVKVKRLTK